ncbi:SocA family protein [Candidatus Parcubacteria bacterium]|nr:SocA family protein [Candidatus Parcubacteria bacterium]
MKLSYLIDLVAIDKGKNKIFDFQYIRYNYGPFDKNIYKCLESLVDDNIIREGANISSTGDEFVTYNINKKNNISFDKISDDEKEIIDEVLESLEGYGTKALTELTYRTKPMKKLKATLNNKAGLNKPLNLNA